MRRARNVEWLMLNVECGRLPQASIQHSTLTIQHSSLSSGHVLLWGSSPQNIRLVTSVGTDRLQPVRRRPRGGAVHDAAGPPPALRPLLPPSGGKGSPYWV